jgi:hypothetical protein
LHYRWLRSLVNLNKFVVFLIASMITRTLKHTAFFLTILLLPSVAYAQQKNSAYQWANTFGYVKNGQLVANGQSPEPMPGHINWALGQPLERVKQEIINQANLAEPAALQANQDRAYRTFGWLKNARLMVEENRTEPYGGHVNWCMGVDRDVYRQAIQEELRKIKRAGTMFN